VAERSFARISKHRRTVRGYEPLHARHEAVRGSAQVARRSIPAQKSGWSIAGQGCIRLRGRRWAGSSRYGLEIAMPIHALADRCHAGHARPPAWPARPGAPPAEAAESIHPAPIHRLISQPPGRPGHPPGLAPGTHSQPVTYGQHIGTGNTQQPRPDQASRQPRPPSTATAASPYCRAHSQLRHRIQQALLAVEGVIGVSEHDNGDLACHRHPSGEALTRAAARVVDDMADCMRQG